MGKSTFVCGLFIVLAISGTAFAGQLATAPAQANFGGQLAMYCDIVNMGNTTKNVTIEAKDFSGVVTSTLTTPLAPGAGASLLETGTGAYCVFTVPGSAKKYRAAAIYYSNNLYTIVMDAH